MQSDLEKEIHADLRLHTTDIFAGSTNDLIHTIEAKWPSRYTVSYKLTDPLYHNASNGTQMFELVWQPWDPINRREIPAIIVYKEHNSDAYYDSLGGKQNQEDETIELRGLTVARARVREVVLEGTPYNNTASWGWMTYQARLRSFAENGKTVHISSRIAYNARKRKEQQLIWEIEHDPARVGSSVWSSIEILHRRPLQKKKGRF